MSNLNLPSLLGSTLADALAKLLDFSAASTAGTATAGIADALLEGRRNRRRRILFQEISDCRRKISDAYEAEEIVQISCEFEDAVRKNTARLNLRLMAKVLKSQYEREEACSDTFHRYSQILASLTREEVIFLACLYRHFQQSHGRDYMGVYKDVEEAVIDTTGHDHKAVKAIAAALQRTGFLLPINASAAGGVGYYVEPSQALGKVIDLASFEDALRDEDEAKD